MEDLKRIGVFFLFGLLITMLVTLIANSPPKKAYSENPTVTNTAIVVTCEDLFTFGGIHYKETVFQGDKMVAIFSSGQKNFSFVRRDGGCWKFIGRNDRHETKKRKSTE